MKELLGGQCSISFMDLYFHVMVLEGERKSRWPSFGAVKAIGSRGEVNMEVIYHDTNALIKNISEEHNVPSGAFT